MASSGDDSAGSGLSRTPSTRRLARASTSELPESPTRTPRSRRSLIASTSSGSIPSLATSGPLRKSLSFSSSSSYTPLRLDRGKRMESTDEEEEDTTTPRAMLPPPIPFSRPSPSPAASLPTTPRRPRPTSMYELTPNASRITRVNRDSSLSSGESSSESLSSARRESLASTSTFGPPRRARPTPIASHSRSRSSVTLVDTSSSISSGSDSGLAKSTVIGTPRRRPSMSQPRLKGEVRMTDTGNDRTPQQAPRLSALIAHPSPAKSTSNPISTSFTTPRSSQARSVEKKKDSYRRTEDEKRELLRLVMPNVEALEDRFRVMGLREV